MMRSLRTGIAVALALFVSSSLQAGLLPVSATSIPMGDTTRFAYGIVLTSDSVLKPGDYFTVYDFAGYIPGSASAVEGFSFSSAGLGRTSSNLTPIDNPAIGNLTWTYTGTDPIVGQVGLGTFMASTSLTGQSIGDFTARTHRLIDGRVDNNITDTRIPVPNTDPQTPEPASLLMAGIGLPILGGLRYLRKKKQI